LTKEGPSVLLGCQALTQGINLEIVVVRPQNACFPWPTRARWLRGLKRSRLLRCFLGSLRRKAVEVMHAFLLTTPCVSVVQPTQTNSYQALQPRSRVEDVSPIALSSTNTPHAVATLLLTTGATAPKLIKSRVRFCTASAVRPGLRQPAVLLPTMPSAVATLAGCS
jgi:hypothetical protein